MHPIKNNTQSIITSAQDSPAVVVRQAPPVAAPKPATVITSPVIDPATHQAIRELEIIKKLAKTLIEDAEWPNTYNHQTLEFYPLACEILAIYKEAASLFEDRRGSLSNLFYLLHRLHAQKDGTNANCIRRWISTLPSKVTQNPTTSKKLIAIEKLAQFSRIKNTKVGEIISKPTNDSEIESLKLQHGFITSLSDLLFELLALHPITHGIPLKSASRKLFKQIANKMDEYARLQTNFKVNAQHSQIKLKQKRVFLNPTTKELPYRDVEYYTEYHDICNTKCTYLKKQLNLLLKLIPDFTKFAGKYFSAEDAEKIHKDEDLLGIGSLLEVSKADPITVKGCEEVPNEMARAYRAYYQALIRFDSGMKGLELLMILLEKTKSEFIAYKEALIQSAEATREGIWLDLFEQETTLEELELGEETNEVEGIEEEELEEEIENLSPSESKTTNIEPWQAARHLFNKQLTNIKGSSNIHSKLAQKDALYHYDVFSAATCLNKTAAQEKTLLPFSQFVLLRSSTLAAELMLTARNKAVNPSAPYTHMHKQMIVGAKVRWQEKDIEFIDSINGCGVYHRYNNYARQQFAVQKQPVPQTLRWIAYPESFTAEHVNTYVTQTIQFLTQRTGDFQIEETSSEKNTPSVDFQAELLMIKDLIECIQKMKKKKKNAVVWQEVGHYLQLLQKGLNSLNTYPQARFFLAHIDGVLSLLQLIDEQLETELFYVNTGERNRIHDLEIYRDLRRHLETAHHQSIVQGLNIQTGMQYPNKWQARHQPTQEAITLRFKAAEITNANDDTAMAGFEQTSKRRKGGGKSMPADDKAKVKAQLQDMLEGCLKMAQAKLDILEY